MNKESSRTETIAVLIIGLISAFLFGALISYYVAPAGASTQVPEVGHAAWTQPYGGCDEAWQAPRSEGAEACRAHGWTIRPRLVVGPHGVVRYSRLPECAQEDGSGRQSFPCSRNFHLHDVGLSYYITGTWAKHRAHYVWSPRPARAHGWRFMTPAQRRMTGAPNRTCVWLVGETTFVACANGWNVSS